VGEIIKEDRILVEPTLEATHPPVTTVNTDLSESFNALEAYTRGHNLVDRGLLELSAVKRSTESPNA